MRKKNLQSFQRIQDRGVNQNVPLPVSKHPIAYVLEQVPKQIARVSEAGVEPSGLLPGVSPHVVLQGGALTEALHTLVTPVGLLPGVSPHVHLQD